MALVDANDLLMLAFRTCAFEFAFFEIGGNILSYVFNFGVYAAVLCYADTYKEILSLSSPLSIYFPFFSLVVFFFIELGLKIASVLPAKGSLTAFSGFY